MQYLPVNTATIRVGPFENGAGQALADQPIKDTEVWINGLPYSTQTGEALCITDGRGLAEIPVGQYTGEVKSFRIDIQSAATLWMPFFDTCITYSTAQPDLPIPSAQDGHYATIRELRNFKVSGATIPEIAAYSDAEIGIDIALAESVIESICADIFYSKPEVNWIDGNGMVRLFFVPAITYPVISVTSIKEYDVDQVDVIDTYEQGVDFMVYGYYIETVRAYSDDTARRRFGKGRVWPRGQKNLRIEGVWGRSVTPPEIKRATQLLALERLVPGSTGVMPKDMSQVSWSDFTASFKPIEAGMSTGFEEVDRLLYLHVNRVSMFNVVPSDRSLYGNALSFR